MRMYALVEPFQGASLTTSTRLQCLNTTFIVMRIVLLRKLQHQALHLLPLSQLFLRILGVHIIPNRRQRRLQLLLRGLHLLQNLPPDLRPGLLLKLLVPQVLVLQPLLKAGDRVVSRLPGIHLVVGPVGEAIVAGTVVGDSVAHELEQNGFPAVLERPAPGFFGGLVHGEDVRAVDAQAFDAVSDASHGDAVAAVLLGRGRRDGEAVVPADEDHRAVPRRGEIEGAVEVALAGGSVAEVCHRDSGRFVAGFLVLELHRVSGARCVGNLCS